MSSRPHPLRQSYTVDYANLNTANRHPSATSSTASSGYYTSDSYDLGRASTISSITTSPSPFGPSVLAHKRGMSEAAIPRHSPSRSGTPDDSNPQDVYTIARQSLRPLPQAPPPSPPPHRTPGTGKTPPRHERGQTIDIGRLSLSDDRKSPTPTRSPNTSRPTSALAQNGTSADEWGRSQAPLSRSSNIRPSTIRGKTVDTVSVLPKTQTSPRTAYELNAGTGTLDGGKTSSSTRPTSVRGKSIDMGSLSVDGGRTSPTPTARSTNARPTSMLLTRLDSFQHAPGSNPTGALVHAPLATPDLQQLGRSTTSQLRTLSTLGAEEDFAITSPTQEVVGLRGRRRLQRALAAPTGDRFGFGGRNWMDKQRQFLQAYEFLCHIGEAKEWIEDIIHRQIPPIVQLEEALRDGVTFAEIVEALNPERRIRIFRHPRLQARHWENLHQFFHYLDEVELPDLFRFELVDLYEKKNIPKVIYCIHALSWLLFRKGIVDFRIGNLVGQLEFEHHELEAMQKGLDKLGVNMPSFGTMGANFGLEPPTPEPEESEEERIDRKLAENEGTVIDLQGQIRGALLRMQLADVMNQLWDSEAWLVDLQSRIRGDWTRQVMGYRLQMKKFAVKLQSAARAHLVRNGLTKRENFWKSKEKNIIKLQSMIRAVKVRDDVHDTLSALSRTDGPVRSIQAMCKGFLAREKAYTQREETDRLQGPIMKLQSAIRGALVRGQVDNDLYLLEQVSEPIIGIQAAARAMVSRSKVNHQYRCLKACATTTKLQSAIRGTLLRARLEGDLCLLEKQTKAIRGLQAAARAMLTRSQVNAQYENLKDGEATTNLQSAVRGMLLRGRLADDLSLLDQESAAVGELQAAARAMLTRLQVTHQRDSLEGFASTWTAVQAIGRGKLVRSDVDATKAELEQHSPEVGSLQACARAAAVRREIADKLDGLSENEEAIVDLQSMARGVLERQRIATDLDDLDTLTPETIDMQARIRGSLCRQKQLAFLEELESHEAEIVTLQAVGRAMLCRGHLAELLAELDEHEEAIVELQALSRAFIVRGHFAEKKKHFNENMQKVVKIQSFVRAKLQGEAYKSLTTGKNPPVGAVKNFVHLLNDSDFDFNEEVEFERMRKTVVQQVRQNEMLEQYIDQLDIKIALLVKNKITIDEVVRHQSNFGGHASSLLALNTSTLSAHHFDLKALNKSSRKKLESYQQLFFNLQTQPQYLARLFRRLRERGTPEKECKRIEHLMMGLFGYAQKRREEYYLLKLITRSIREEVDSCKSIQDYLRGHFFCLRLLGNYTRSPRDRKYLRDLLGPLIRDNIVEDPALDLESDPMQIYRSAINNEELRTGRPSRRPLDITRDLAIKDPETRELFIDHLRDLREICNQFFTALEDYLPRMPYGLRFVCRQTYEALGQRFQREPPHQVLQLISHWLWRFYLQPALVNPEQVGFHEKVLGPLQKRNLGEVAKVLGQAASGRPFGGDNIYLQPLNAFVAESTERLAAITNNLISVADAESTFDIDEFNDLYAKNKPTLYIKLNDIFAIHNLVASELGHVSPGRDDVLREIMLDLGSAKNNENEMSGASGASDIQMFLSPKLHDLDDPEAEVKALFMETKRCILYIIRVQTGANLLDILVRPPTQEDELKWQAVLHEDFDNEAAGDGTPRTKGAYSDLNMVDVTRLSYYDMKRNALENIMRLEQMGRISKKNYYQDVLNAIALDIRTKSRRRVQRQREIEGVRMTLSNLHEKAEYLEQQRKSYDNYIEQAMATLQRSKGKKRFLLPFTKQYNHQRELERSGRVPKFGSYKYSVRALADKGVVMDWQGAPERDWGVINLTISCDEVGVFNLEGSRGHIQIPGASALVPIEDLLQAQFEAHQFMNLFEGNLRLNVNLLLHLLYKKFYRTQ